MIRYFRNLDSKALNYINKRCRSKTLDKVMPLITALGNLGIIWFLISFLLISKVDYRIIGVMLILALVLTTIIGEGVIKHIVRRKRPVVYEEELLINKPITYSFPSGHTASSFAALAVLVQMNGKLGIIVSPIATLIAFSRLYLKVHYLTDVIFGIILGTICGFVVVSVLGNLTF